MVSVAEGHAPGGTWLETRLKEQYEVTATVRQGGDVTQGPAAPDGV